MRLECHGGETGRRAGFKIQLGQLSAGSIPARGTKAKKTTDILSVVFFCA